MTKLSAISAVANAGTQLSMTGSVNWGKVGQSALGGAIGAGMSYGIGELMGHGFGTLGEFAAKTGAHSVSGGIQSWAMGGNFGSGMVSGGIGYTSGAIGTGLGGEAGGFAGSTLGGGVGAWATGGDVYQGAQIGAMGYLFNHMGSKLVNSGLRMVDKILNRDSYNRSPQTESCARKQKWIKCTTNESLLHKIGGPSAWGNTKYVSQDGHFEAVYNNGQLVPTGINRGSYNIFSHRADPVNHVIFDVVPFLMGL